MQLTGCRISSDKHDSFATNDYNELQKSTLNCLFGKT